jgi:hypothetical protein
MPEDRAGHETYPMSRETYDIMARNVNSFLHAFPEITRKKRIKTDRAPTIVRYKHMFAQDYIASVPNNTEVDCVYLDPSWHKNDGQTHKYEQSPSDLFAYLQEIIWTPIEQKGIKVGCYVLKTRWNWLDVQQYLTTLDSHFIAAYSIEAKQLRLKLGEKGDYGQVQGLFHYMVLIHRDYKTIPSRNSQMYWDIVRNGKNIWVRKDTVVRPGRPRYAEHLDFPAIREVDPRDDNYFMVEAPPALHQHEQARSNRVDVDKVRFYEEERDGDGHDAEVYEHDDDREVKHGRR